MAELMIIIGWLAAILLGLFIAFEIYLWLKKEKKPQEEEVPPSTDIDSTDIDNETAVKSDFKNKCEYCNKPINNIMSAYKCKYCNEYHCDKHRLPEDHKCENPQTPKEMMSARIQYSKKKKSR